MVEVGGRGGGVEGGGGGEELGVTIIWVPKSPVLHGYNR